MISFGRITDLVNNAKELTYQSTLFFVFSQEDIQLFAVELNTGDPNISDRGQLFLHGVDANGIELSQIGGDYSPITKDLKQFQGLPFDRVTLYDEGDFYRSWNFVNTSGGFILEADTIKEGEDLRNRWGKGIIGLNDESIQKLIIEVVPWIISYILRELLR